jgi:hypothetical protein
VSHSCRGATSGGKRIRRKKKKRTEIRTSASRRKAKRISCGEDFFDTAKTLYKSILSQFARREREKKNEGIKL